MEFPGVGRWQYRTLCLGMEEVVPVMSLVQLALFIHCMSALKCRTLDTNCVVNRNQCYIPHVHSLHIWPSMEAGLDPCNKAVSDKTPQIFDLRCPLST